MYAHVKVKNIGQYTKWCNDVLVSFISEYLLDLDVPLLRAVLYWVGNFFQVISISDIIGRNMCNHVLLKRHTNNIFNKTSRLVFQSRPPAKIISSAPMRSAPGKNVGWLRIYFHYFSTVIILTCFMYQDISFRIPCSVRFCCLVL